MLHYMPRHHLEPFHVGNTGTRLSNVSPVCHSQSWCYHPLLAITRVIQDLDPFPGDNPQCNVAGACCTMFSLSIYSYIIFYISDSVPSPHQSSLPASPPGIAATKRNPPPDMSPTVISRECALSHRSSHTHPHIPHPHSPSRPST